jgi:integrase
MIALAVIIAINTAQRPSDICAMKWSQYDGKYITLKQIKTGATVTIPVTAELKIALDDARRARSEGKVVSLDPDGPIAANEYTGRAWLRRKFSLRFRELANAAGIPDELQFRDLRRTATTHLAEAGCSLHEIAAIGGWAVDTVARMMTVYGKVNVTMADNAILKLEQYRSKRLLEG